MKIIQVTAAYKPAYVYGGPTMSVAKLCECLNAGEMGSCGVEEMGSWEAGELGSWEDGELGSWDKKIDIEVFTTTANGNNELDVEPNKYKIVDGVNVTYFKRLTKDHTHFSPKLLWALKQEIFISCKRNTSNEKRPTTNDLLIHIHAWWNLVSVLSCAVAMWYKIPVLLSPRGMLTSYTQGNKNSFIKNLIHQLFGKRLLKYCHIHATSEQEKKDILSIVKPKSITVIPNLVQLQQPKTKNEKRKTTNEQQTTKFSLIFLSRIEEKKGLELLFDALATLAIDYTLTIAGSGDENYINALKLKGHNLKITEKLSWIGHVKNEDKFNLLANHDLMVLTSYNENFANVVVESLSVGTPVILSDQVGLSNYINQHDLGWITELNTHSISSSLKTAYQDIDKRNRIASLAPQLIEKDFNDQSLVKKYITLYEELANGRL